MNLDVNLKLQCDPSPAFRDYLTAHFTALEKRLMNSQASLDTLTSAMAILVADVTEVNTNVLSVLAKLAEGGGLTATQQDQLDAAVAALQGQNAAIEAVDAQLKAVLP